jgi:hypothetical protein
MGMRTIFKYRLAPQIPIEMPVGAEVLCVGTQDEDIFLWASVNPDPSTVTEMRNFLVYGTGHPITPGPSIYLGTVHMDNGLVFHVFES